MKIAISANALKHGGGFERYAMDLARELAARGIKPAFFARRFDPALPETALVEAHRINVAFLPGKLRDHWFSWRLRRLRRAAGVDVLIGCNRVDSSEIAICGGTHRGFVQAMGREPTRADRWQIALEARQYEHAQIVIAHSPSMRDELRTLYGVPEAKIRMLYPPVDAARFAPVGSEARMALRRQFGFADDEVILLFPSTSHERKGLPLIEAAVREMALPVVVAVAGRPPERTSERIRYIGYVKNIEDGYRAADFTILASRYEPFGLVGIESVMCGTPAILARNIGCCDAISPAAKHLFAPGDAAALRAVLQACVAGVRAGERLAGGHTAVRAALTYDPRVDAHVNVLLELAEQVAARQRHAISSRAVVDGQRA
ncbi:glycosyltransferase family 4 protein [Trinickia caryophylli]|uniref:Glycosyltransferase involved in cell wall bisynthesis n=1 Tax=Trinickia caryophylli TaxID=28094 RepID=A0A1X7GTH9_TRICW|nr:glycosyltransferase family 4 protein [Trinickia caryophylli]PMS08927.1 glycosyl transferase family 1 [Trinickia caryophylli]TRX18135.1 glycosyltransferase family 4 protein [Trinickia caryophylli]WQE11081.1 glycosyltransferase family 4 protein [Trinickia caryophylli]SMF74457.1 Glycosyltransferase involved in cell wall bisynthesis [Trinickia caryophylli]